MSPRILADTGPLVALFNRRDAHHTWAVSRFREFTTPCLTCEAVLAEALFLLSRQVKMESRLIELWTRDSLQVVFSAEHEKPAIDKLMKKYADCPMSLADACMVRMSEIHSHCAVWTVDTDFLTYRRNGRQTIPVIMP